MSDAYRPITSEQRLPSPLNGTIYTTTRRVAAERPLPVLGATMEGELGAAWADSVLVGVSEAPGEGGLKTLTLVHARIPTEAEQVASNWEYATCSIGGQQFPSVQRSFVVLASAVAAASPAPGSAMPTIAGQIFDGEGYILVERQVAQGESQLEPVFRIERRSYVKRSTTRQVSVDQLNGLPLLAKTDIYQANEVVYTKTGPDPQEMKAYEVFDTPPAGFFGLQADGWQRTGQQLSCAWYSIESEQVIAGTPFLGLVNVDPSPGHYDATENFSWPPVLKSWSLFQYPRRDGGIDLFPHMKFEPDGYDGPCRCEVKRVWSRLPHTIPAIKVLQPTAIHYACPFFTLSIPACLHGEVKLECNIGNTDSTYEEAGDSLETFDATTFDGANCLVWPASLVAYDDQEPYRGGWLRTTKTVFKPTSA